MAASWVPRRAERGSTCRAFPCARQHDTATVASRFLRLNALVEQATARPDVLSPVRANCGACEWRTFDGPRAWESVQFGPAVGWAVSEIVLEDSALMMEDCVFQACTRRELIPCSERAVLRQPISVDVPPVLLFCLLGAQTRMQAVSGVVVGSGVQEKSTQHFLPSASS